MNSMLRPMSLGETLNRIWSILRRRPRLFIAIGAVPIGVLLLCVAAMFGILYALGDFPQPQAAQLPGKTVEAVLLAIGITMIPMMAAYAVFHAAACNAALAVSRGLEISWAGAYRAAFAHTGRYLWLMLLCWLAVSAPVLVVYALFAAVALLPGTQGSPGAWFVLFPLVLIGYIGTTVYMIWMMLRLGLAFPAAAAEDIPAVEAIRRSLLLTRNSKGRIFLVMLVVYAISYGGIIAFELVLMALAGILGLIGMAFHLNLHQPVAIAGIVLGALAGMAALFIVMGLLYSAYAISLSVLYEDQVLRIEGPPAFTGGAA